MPKEANGKKKLVIEEIFRICQEKNDYIFDNDLVRDVSKKHGFMNPFEVTKWDNTQIFPQILIDNDYFVSHLGKGRHCFVRGIVNGYHTFEKITDIEEWEYKKSLLNEFDKSESNMLSVAYNHGITHNFLYKSDRRANLNIYNARRTKYSLSYRIGSYEIETDKVQMEIDLTMEHDKTVTVFEGKNGSPGDFAVYQIYHPFLYYHTLRREKQLDIREINCCYLLRHKGKQGSIIKMYLYTFDTPDNMASIRLVKSRQYNLVAG